MECLDLCFLPCEYLFRLRHAECNAIQIYQNEIERAKQVVYPAVDFLGKHEDSRPRMLGLTEENCGDDGSTLFYGDLEHGLAIHFSLIITYLISLRRSSGRVYVIRPGSNQLFHPLFEEYQRQALDRTMFKRSPLKATLRTSCSDHTHKCHY